MRMTGREMPCDHMETAHTQRGRGAAEVRCRERIRYQLAALLSHRIQGPTALDTEERPKATPALISCTQGQQAAALLRCRDVKCWCRV